MAKRAGFPSRGRLRKRADFLVVQSRGRRVSGRYFLFFAYRRADPGIAAVAARARFGITVTRKVGNAVTRNRIKRVLREGFRHLADRFSPDLDLVAVARATAIDATSQDALVELSDVAHRLTAGAGTGAGAGGGKPR